MEYDNTNSGALFRNDKKGNDKAPDYKGNLNVDGKEKQIAAWLKTSAKGVKYMSLSVSEPYQAQGDAVQQSATAIEIEEDIPF